MPAVTPQVFSATATTTPTEHVATTPRRQFLIEHLDDSPAAELTITWNGGGNWILRPGVSLAMYLKSAVERFTVVAASGTVRWQAFLQD